MQYIYSGNGSPVATNTTAKELLSLYLDTSAQQTYIAISTTNPSGFVPLLQANSNFVTAVNVSGGSTGLTTTGGPVTGVGTITLAGTLQPSNGGTGLTALANGLTTWFTTPTSANLAATMTDETGTGSLVFNTSPTINNLLLNAAQIQAGYLYLPQNSQSANYTTVLGDSGYHILHPSTDNNLRAFTIAANSVVAYPLGTEITFINRSALSLTISIATDTMYLAGTTTTGNRTLAQNGIAKATKVESTVWIIAGTGLT